MSHCVMESTFGSLPIRSFQKPKLLRETWEGLYYRQVYKVWETMRTEIAETDLDPKTARTLFLITDSYEDGYYCDEVKFKCFDDHSEPTETWTLHNATLNRFRVPTYFAGYNEFERLRLDEIPFWELKQKYFEIDFNFRDVTREDHRKNPEPEICQCCGQEKRGSTTRYPLG